MRIFQRKHEKSLIWNLWIIFSRELFFFGKAVSRSNDCRAAFKLLIPNSVSNLYRLLSLLKTHSLFHPCTACRDAAVIFALFAATCRHVDTSSNTIYLHDFSVRINEQNGGICGGDCIKPRCCLFCDRASFNVEHD